MKRIITAILCGALFAGVFANSASAQPMGQAGQMPGNYPQSYFEGQGSYDGGYGGGTGAMRTTMPGNFPEHMYLAFTGVDEGLGFEGSYFTVGSLLPFYYDNFDGNWFFDNRWHVSENGGFFANLGIGRRQKIGDTVTGLGLWYDYDNDKYDIFGHAFNQLAGSIEIKNPEYEFNFNGYVPIGNTDYFYGSNAVPFVGNLMLIQPGYDVALSGLDTEFGVAIPGMEHWAAKVFAGYYFYDAIEPDTPINGFGGARARFEFSPHHRLSFNLQVNHDDTFKTTGFLNVNWHLFGARHPAVSSQTLQPVVRNAHIVRRHQDWIAATNPKTGSYYNVVHVNNTVPSGGNGSLEMPFDTLTAAQNNSMENDLIYVHGTGIQYQNMIQLQDCQFLIGSGPGNVTVDTLEVGQFQVPSITDMNPLIGNPLGPSVFLADDNTVGRIIFNGRQGIQGNAIKNPRIIANTFLNNDTGVSIANSTGLFQILDNEFNGAAVDGARISGSDGVFVVSGNRFLSNQLSGITFMGDTGFLEVFNNRFGNTAQQPLSNFLGLNVVSTVGAFEVDMHNNVVVGNTQIGAAFESRNSGTTLTVGVHDNLFQRNLGDALRFTANTGSTLNAHVFDETFIGNGTAGGGVAIRGFSTDVFASVTPSILNLLVEDVSIDVGGGGDGVASGISLEDTANGNIFATIRNTTIANPLGIGTAGYGIFAGFLNTTGVASTVDIENVLVDGAAGGMQFSAGSLGAINIFNSVAQNNTAEGMLILSNTGILDIRVENSSFSNNGTDGVGVASANSGVLLFTAINSQFNNNGDHGFELHAAPVAPQFFGFFVNSDFLNNAGAQDFLAQIDAGPNPPLHNGTLLCLSFSQTVASSPFQLTNNADPINTPEFGTILFEDDGTNVPGFGFAGPGPITPVAFGTCAVGAAPFRLQ